MNKSEFIEICADPEFLDFVPWHKIKFKKLEEDALGEYDKKSDSIFIDESLRSAHAVVKLEVITHELAHRFAYKGFGGLAHDRYLSAFSWGFLKRWLGDRWCEVDRAGLVAHDLRDDASEDAFKFAITVSDRIKSAESLRAALDIIERVCEHRKTIKKIKHDRDAIIFVIFIVVIFCLILIDIGLS